MPALKGELYNISGLQYPRRPDDLNLLGQKPAEINLHYYMHLKINGGLNEWT